MLQDRLDDFELEDGAGNTVTATTLLTELSDEELEDLLQPLADSWNKSNMKE